MRTAIAIILWSIVIIGIATGLYLGLNGSPLLGFIIPCSSVCLMFLYEPVKNLLKL